MESDENKVDTKAERKESDGDGDTKEADNSQLKSSLQDWEELSKEFIELQAEHENYKRKLEETKSIQKKCLSGIAHQRYRLKKMADSFKGLQGLTDKDKECLADLQLKMLKRKTKFRDFEDNLPHRNGLYLSIILGQVNVSLLNKEDKYLYKQDYERFKLTLSYIIFGISLFLVSARYLMEFTKFSGMRWIDAILHFLLVWYYCTLTIREHILIVNGSRIKGWWLLHHFVSTACSAITLIWPDGWCYQSFRTQYGWFILYIAFVQVLQYYYQQGCLYRLKALGQRHDMDITVGFVTIFIRDLHGMITLLQKEGFMSWMFKGLAFLLPFLFIGYFFQLYNAIVLYNLSRSADCNDWQVPVLSLIHLVLFLGNMATTLKVIKQKYTEELANTRRFYRNKYRFNNKQKNV